MCAVRHTAVVRPQVFGSGTGVQEGRTDGRSVSVQRRRPNGAVRTTSAWLSSNPFVLSSVGVSNLWEVTHPRECQKAKSESIGSAPSQI